jgi:hypothetical protein
MGLSRYTTFRINKLFKTKKKERLLLGCAYGFLRSIRTITAPTITIATIIAATAGMKY